MTYTTLSISNNQVHKHISSVLLSTVYWKPPTFIPNPPSTQHFSNVAGTHKKTHPISVHIIAIKISNKAIMLRIHGKIVGVKSQHLTLHKDILAVVLTHTHNFPQPNIRPSAPLRLIYLSASTSFLSNPTSSLSLVHLTKRIACAAPYNSSVFTSRPNPIHFLSIYSLPNHSLLSTPNSHPFFLFL